MIYLYINKVYYRIFVIETVVNCIYSSFTNVHKKVFKIRMCIEVSFACGAFYLHISFKYMKNESS